MFIHFVLLSDFWVLPDASDIWLLVRLDDLDLLVPSGSIFLSCTAPGSNLLDVALDLATLASSLMGVRALALVVLLGGSGGAVATSTAGSKFKYVG